MTIQVLLAGTDEAAIILLDDVNNESVLVPLCEIDEVLKKISDIRMQEYRARSSRQPDEPLITHYSEHYGANPSLEQQKISRNNGWKLFASPEL